MEPILPFSAAGGTARPPKNQNFRARLGFAWSGMRRVWLRERTFRAQMLLGAAALIATALSRPGWLWAAAIILATGFVLALELANAALEYALDTLHPGFSREIGFAKDAAAGAVLAASIASACVGAAMLISVATR